MADSFLNGSSSANESIHHPLPQSRRGDGWKFFCSTFTVTFSNFIINVKKTNESMSDLIQANDWNSIFESNLDYIIHFKEPPCVNVNLKLTSTGKGKGKGEDDEDEKDDLETETIEMDIESDDLETEDVEIDVETEDETTRLQYPMIALNPAVFEAYDRSTINLESEDLESDYASPFTEEDVNDGELDCDWRQHGTIKIIDPLVIDPVVLKELSNQLLEILADFKTIIHKCKDHAKKQQLFYDLRTTMMDMARVTSAQVTSIIQKCISTNEFVDRFEKRFSRDLYLVGFTEDVGDSDDLSRSDRAVADIDRLKLGYIDPLPYLNMCCTYFNPATCDQYPLSLSMNSLGRYLLLFTYFRRIRGVSNYANWTACTEAYFVVLGKILSRFHKVISSQSPRIQDFMKNSLEKYLVTAAMNWYTEEDKKIQADIESFSSVPLSTQEWVQLKCSYPPIFFKQEAENLRQLFIRHLRKI